MPRTNSRYFWHIHLTTPLIALIALSIILEASGADIRLADKIYAWEGGSWALKNAWITKTVIHQTGRNLSLFLALIVIAGLITTFISTKVRKYRRELVYLLCAAGGSSILISLLKEITHVSCPWDFDRYGGEIPYESVLSQIIHASGEGCFPAGHASGGYAWLALYFLGTYKNSNLRWIGLTFALCVGIVFGFSQQLRGAHFISHDLWTLGICWLFSLLLFKLMLIGKTSKH